jgi:hypothetical protein
MIAPRGGLNGAIPDRKAEELRRLMDFISRSDAVARDHTAKARTGGR